MGLQKRVEKRLRARSGFQNEKTIPSDIILY